MTRAAALWSLCVLVTSACSGEGAGPTQVRERGIGSSAAPGQGAPLLPPPPGPRPPSGRAPISSVRRPPPPPPSTAPGTGAGAGGDPGALAGANEPAREPDHAATLRQAFGTPTECISAATRARVRDRLVVSLSVTTVDSGRVTRASVQGAGLSEEDRACMARRAESLRLVGTGARSISAAIEFAVQSTPQTRTERTPEWARPAGSLAPDRTLPATGGQGPARGSVAPGVTTEPAGTADRPAGSVAPSITLPAVAEPDGTHGSYR